MKAWFSFPYSPDIYFQEGKPMPTPISNHSLFLQTFDKKEKMYLDIKDAKILQNEELKLVHRTLQTAPTIKSLYYTKLVSNGIKEIEKGSFKKVVLARCKEVPYSKNPIDIFKNLCMEYHNCFAHLVQFDEGYYSIGATPERLLHWSPEKVISSSIAGTVSEDNATFTTKEKEEQDIVTDYIVDVFTKYGLPVSTSQKFIGNGNVKHLFTEILSEQEMSQSQAIALMEDLNPTPAVGGFPKESSLQWISDNEKLERHWYSGAIGIINQELIRTYVNLRCGLLFDQKAILYAGAGITSSSIPQKEFMETEIKMSNLGDMIS